MRLWILSLVFCCCAVAVYAQDTDTEDTKEVVASDEEVGVDSRGCNCKPKPKS